MQENDMFFKVNVNTIQSKALLGLKAPEFRTLVTLASFANDNGECYPSQVKLAELSGVSERSVRTHIKRLIEYRTPEGEPIIELRKVKSAKGNYHRSIYKLLEGSGLGFGKAKNLASNWKKTSEQKEENFPQDGRKLPYNNNQEQEPRTITIEQDTNEIDISNFNSKTLIQYFRKKYNNVYGIEYSMTGKDYGRFGRILKNKVLNVYEPELIIAATDKMFEVYEKRWAKEGFERPTLYNYSNFVFQESITLAQEAEKKTKERKNDFAEQQRKADEQLKKFETEEDMIAMLNKMNNRNKR